MPVRRYSWNDEVRKRMAARDQNGMCSEFVEAVTRRAYFSMGVVKDDDRAITWDWQAMERETP